MNKATIDRGCRGWREDRISTRRGYGCAVLDVPFEFVGEVASSSAVAKTCHVESSATARHGCAWCGESAL